MLNVCTFKWLIVRDEIMRELFRVTEEHQASFDYAFIAEKGDVVVVSKEDDETPGWFWCMDMDGREAWVPETHLNIDGDRGTFVQPYNSIEHSVSPGDTVQYLGETLGWMECLNSKWEYGWIPIHKVERINK
jgi:hypothetical protein